MGVISNLVVKLTADVGQYERNMAKSQATASKWSRVNKAATRTAAVGLGAFAVEAKKAVSTYNDYGSTIRKISRLTDSSTEDISTLVGQWKRYGIEGQQGMTALKILSKQIVAARSGNKAAIESFAELGISIEDLNNKNAAQILMQARDAMSGMEDKTLRTATALKLFGRSGTEMMAWLDVGADDMADLNERLKELGLVWGDKELDNWKDMAKAQKELQLTMMAFHMKVAQSIVPLFTSLLDAVQPFVNILVGLGDKLKYVAGAFALLLGAKWVLGFFATLKTTLATLGIAQFTTSLSGAGGAITSFAGKAGLIGAALAGTGVAVYEAVGAFREFRKAALQAEEAAENALALVNKLKGTKYEAAFAKMEKEGRGSSLGTIEKQIEEDRYKSKWYNPFSWFFAEGGSTVVSKPTAFMAGEGRRPERVTVEPLPAVAGRRADAAAQVHHHRPVNVTIQGVPSRRQLEALKRDLAAVDIGGY